MGVATRDPSVSRRSHNTDPVTRLYALTGVNFYAPKVREEITHRVVAEERNGESAARTRFVDFFDPLVLNANLQNLASSGREHAGVTTLNIGGGVVKVIVVVVDRLMRKRKHIFW